MSHRRVSIVVCVCTHNRAADCAALLSSLDQQSLRPPEVLVVDSGSDERNAEQLRAACAAWPARYIRVDQKGLSLARNAALRAASTADWLAYLDDDALAEPDWYETLHGVLQGADTATAIIGGRVTPIWPSGGLAPRSARWRRLLSCVEDDAPGLVADGANICGSNLTIRRAELEQLGGFPLELGRVGDLLLGGEEWYVIYRFIQAGLKALYEPSIRVRHKVSAVRLTRSWMEERAYWEGVTHSRLCDLGVLPRRYFLRDLPMRARLLTLWILKSVFANDADWNIRYHWTRGVACAPLSAAGELYAVSRPQ